MPPHSVSISIPHSPPRAFTETKEAELEGMSKQLTLATDWKISWNKIMSHSLSEWFSWELPAQLSEKFWLCPCLTEEIQELRFTHQGTAPFLLSLFSTFPKSKKACSDISTHIFIFFIWDDWLKKYSTYAELHSLSEFMKNIDGKIESKCNFPLRLDRKYPGKKAEFLRVLESSELFKASDEWNQRYLSCWKSYIDIGLSEHLRLAKIFKNGETPLLNEYLVCRALTHGSLKWFILAFSNQSVELSDEAYKIVSPLLMLASMAASTYGDLFLKNISKETQQLSSVNVYSQEYAAFLYSSILDAIILIKDEIEKSLRASDMDMDSFDFVLTSMDLVLSSFHGITAWYDAAGKFKIEKKVQVKSIEMNSKQPCNFVSQILKIAMNSSVHICN